jgi:hypothetical protein
MGNGLANQRVGGGHVQHILIWGQGQVNEVDTKWNRLRAKVQTRKPSKWVSVPKLPISRARHFGLDIPTFCLGTNQLKVQCRRLGRTHLQPRSSMARLKRLWEPRRSFR